jgi:hypothetical protein
MLYKNMTRNAEPVGALKYQFEMKDAIGSKKFDTVTLCFAQ